MNGLIELSLKLLIKIFGQDKLFEAFKEITERRTKIKLVKLDEQTDLREIKNDIKETKAREKLQRVETKASKKKANVKTSDKGIDFIRGHEGLRLKAYDDLQPNVVNPDPIKGTLTIGYGHTGSDVKPGMSIDEETAIELLKTDVRTSEDAVNGLFEKFGWRKVQNRFDALVSWVFNTGAANLEKRSLIVQIDKLNKAEKSVNDFWNKYYISSKGVQLPGLVKRRAEENELFNKK